MTPSLTISYSAVCPPTLLFNPNTIFSANIELEISALSTVGTIARYKSRASFVNGGRSQVQPDQRGRNKTLALTAPLLAGILCVLI